VIPAPAALVGRFDLVFAVGPDNVMLFDQAWMLPAGKVRRRDAARVLVGELALVF